MAENINTLTLTGLQPLPYSDVPVQLILQTLSPTSANYSTRPFRNLQLGTLWLNLTDQSLWYLAKILTSPKHEGEWLEISSGAGNVETLTGNTGGPVSPDALSNINVVGDGVGITIAGNPATHTLTASLVGGGIAAQSFPTGTNASVVSGGTAVPTAAGVLNIKGNHNVGTGAATANTVTVFGTNTITVGDLAVITAGNNSITVTSGNVTLSGTGANAAGNINIPDTTSDGRQGIISTLLGTRLHNFGVAGGGNVFLGFNAGNINAAAATSFDNTGMGSGSLQNITTGQGNSGFGSGSLANCTIGTGNSSISNGLGFVTTGFYNTGLGHRAGVNAGITQGLTTGSFNTLIGTLAGSDYTGAESSNILIGYITAGTVGESNVTRIGAGTGVGDGQINKCFIAGIRGITTGNADAVAVLVDSANQLGTVSSSARYKENIKDMGSDSEIIYDLKPVTFNYKKFPNAPAWGLIAEDVEQIFPQLVVFKDDQPETIKYHDLVPLMLNEIIKLKKRIDELEKE